MRRPRPLDRASRPVRDASLVVIASEDTYAPKQYFDFFESTRIQFKVLETADGRSAPQHVLDRIEEYIAEYEIGEDDIFWLVCDCDHWIEPAHIANLLQVIKTCGQKDINVALSNPCFDFWLYLHYCEFPTDPAITCKEIGERLDVAAFGFNKRRIYDLKIEHDRVMAAVTRSKANQPHKGAFPTSPQTAVHLIIEKLIEKKIISVKTAKAAAPAKPAKAKKAAKKKS